MTPPSAIILRLRSGQARTPPQRRWGGGQRGAPSDERRRPLARLRPHRDRRRAGGACRRVGRRARRALDPPARREPRHRRPDLPRHHHEPGRRPVDPGRRLLGGRGARGRGPVERCVDRQWGHGVEPRSASHRRRLDRRPDPADRRATDHRRHRCPRAAVRDSRLDLARRDDGRRCPDGAEGARPGPVGPHRAGWDGSIAVAAGGADPARRRPDRGAARHPCPSSRCRRTSPRA